MGSSEHPLESAPATSRDRARAVEAAAALPPAVGDVGTGEHGASSVERVIVAVVAATTFVVTPVWIFVLVWQENGGPLLVAGGIPVWLAVRALVGRMRGGETATVTVDDRGIVHVLSGRRAVHRLRRLFDVGAARWIRQVRVGSLLVVLAGLVGFAVTAVALDAPWLLLLFLTGAGVAMLDLLRSAATRLLRVHRTSHRLLDGDAMLPLLALYARHHGTGAATSGIPADRLAATVAANPAEAAVARDYTARAASPFRPAG